MKTLLQDISTQQYDGEVQSTLAFFQEQFESQYEEGHLVLACHTAFPILLTPDLLYKIWLNFGEYQNVNKETKVIKRIAVSDILLSPLCKEVGREQYEMQADVRFVLLAYLQQYFGKERLDELAHFLLQYVQTYHIDEDVLSKSFRESQEWTALAQLNPNLAAQKIAQSFAEKKGKTTEQLRLNLVVERIAKQVESTNEESESGVSSGFRTLLKYGKGLKDYVFGDEKNAIHSFEVLAKNQSKEGVRIPVPKNVYHKLKLKKTKIKKSQTVFFSIDNNIVGEINFSENEITEIEKLSQFLYSKNYYTNNVEEIKKNYIQLKKIINKHFKTNKIIFRKIKSNRGHPKLHIYGKGTELVNIPWELISINSVELFNHSQIFLTRNFFPISEETYYPSKPLPLRILVMISSPEDSKVERLLNHEGEERALLEAFEPLFEQGQVQIDFTSVGSLEALAEKLKSNYYHILHFSGSSIYHKGTGYLEMEDHLTMNSKAVKAADFASVLNMKPEHRPTLVFLNASLTAQGGRFSGVTNHLLQQNIPAVIAMSSSIIDTYATQFAAKMYSQIAQKEPLHRAFKTALQYIRQEEIKYLKNVREKENILPIQWLSPKLYQSQNLIELVDWSAPSEEMKLDSYRFVSGHERMILQRSLSKQNYFIGRRKEISIALPILLENKPLLLKGQGGMGKTTMAEHLVQRMIARNNRIYPFLFDQTANLETVLENMSDTLEDVYEDFDFQDKLELITKGISKFKFLLKTLMTYCYPLFIFDNLDTFQSEPGKEFRAEHSDISEIIIFLCQRQITPIILTCRYNLSEFPDITTINLNHVSLNDFWKKIRYLHINKLAKYLQSDNQNIKPHDRNTLNYKDIVTWLYDTFGGNFRALEYFDSQFKINPNSIFESIQNLNDFKEEYKDITTAAFQQITTNLTFARLLKLLNTEEQEVFQLLSYFQTPVQIQALQLQSKNKTFSESIKKLQSLSFIEQSENFYYVNQLTKELLQKNIHSNLSFSHRKAGDYYYSRYHNNEDYSLSEIEAGLQHYIKAQYTQRINELGRVILNYYYKQSAFRKALAYAISIEKVVNKHLDTNVRNRIGLIYEVFGEYDKALQLYKHNLDIQQKIRDKSGEGTTLSNLSQIYQARGDYDNALKYLQQSLDIQQQIGDKKGEGTTLSNLSQIYYAKGGYDTALNYLQHSLNIQQQIGDKRGEGTTLNNIGQIYNATGDYDTALKYLKQSLNIQQQIGDKRGEGTALSNLSQISQARGDYDTALKYLQQSLNIQQQIGDKSGEGTTLNNISQIHNAKGDYDTALKYLQQSLAIRQQIGDKSGEGTTLSNLSQISQAKGDYDTALKYLQQSLNIQQQIGDKRGEGTTLNNIGQIYYAKGDYDTALKFLQHSLNIQQQIGDKNGEGITLNNIGQIYNATGDYDTSLKYLQQSLEIQQQIGDKRGEGTALSNLSQIHRTRGDYDNALRCLKQALNIQQQIGDKSGEGTTLSNLSQIYHAKGDYDTALKYVEKSLDIQQQIGNVSGLATALTNIGSIYFSLKQFDQAVLPLLEAYQIFQKMGSPNTQTVESWLNALIEEIGEQRFQEIMERNK